jgi:hypothetical protein
MNDIGSTEPVPPPEAASPSPREAGHHHSETRPLKVRRVSVRHGWYWLIEGFTLWARSPAFISFLIFSCILAIFVAASVPYIGELLSSVLYPGLMLGLYNGCRAIDRKRRLSPGLLFSGFQRRPYDILLAGFCNFIVIKIILLSTILIDGGEFLRASDTLQAPEMVTVVSTPFFYAMLTFVVLLLAWGMAILFASPLIGWWRLSVPKALLLSIRGCLRNWFPLAVYLLFGFGFFICTLPALAINFFNLLMDGLGTVVCAVFLLIALPVLFASSYVAARDIYGLPRRRKHRQHPPPPQAAQAQAEQKKPHPRPKRRTRQQGVRA